MKVLSIGMDRNLFVDESPAQLRALGYAEKTEEYNIIVFSPSSLGFAEKKIGNLNIYPTNSISKFHYMFDAYKIAKSLLNYKELNNWVVTSQDPFETGLPSFFVARKFKLPLQVQVHTDFLSWHFRKNILNHFRVFAAKFILKRADGIRVVSSVIKDSIGRSIGGLKAEPEILPIYVDIDSIIQAPIKRDIDKDFPQFKFIILMASRITREKRIDIAIKSMKEVVQKFPHTGLVICGSGPEKHKLKAYAKRLRLEKSVVFAGWQEDLISYFKTANLFLLTSDYEGYGMTLIEAGAAGCPIVTTRVGIAKTELFQDGVNCEICKFFDPECVAESVISVIGDNQKRELFKHRMQDSIRSQTGSKEGYVQKYISLMEKLLKK